MSDTIVPASSVRRPVRMRRRVAAIALAIAGAGGGVAVSTVLAGHAVAAMTCTGSVAAPVVGMAPTIDGQGYWLADSHGNIKSCGDASASGTVPAGTPNIVAIAGDPAVNGFWLVAANGQVVPFGSAGSFGDAHTLTLTKGIVAMASTTDGKGYWLLGGDGGVFSYGDATYFGSTGNIVLNKPAVGMVSTADGKGYWFVASDGGVFSYGDAGFWGSTGAMTLNKPVVGMTQSSDGKGYRLVAADGGIFSFGDAAFYGSSGGVALVTYVGMAPTPNGGGYWLVDANGDVFTFGNAGSTTTTSPSTTGTSTSSSTTTTTTTPSSTTTSATTTTLASATDPTAVPLGDGHVSTTPKVGYVDSCQTTFGGGGAQAVGPWINTAAGTWNSITKIAVQGSVSWPTAAYNVSTSGTSRIITGNDLPINHTTGTYPVAASDPAHQYDANPNSFTAQNINWTLPLNPTAATQPNCVGMGPIGILNDGILFFNALDAEGRDAGAHEVLDSCGEHPEMTGQAHHHAVPSCILSSATGTSTLVGYAADGYGIYVERDSGGNLLTNADLDACHGRTSTVTWNGTSQSIYHYDATLEYPYTVGCYHGTPINTMG